MSRRFVLVGLAVLLVAMPSVAGVYFESVTKTEGEKAGDVANMTAKGWASGNNAKVELTSAGNPLFSPGMYVLTHDGGKVAYLVDPKEKTYSEWKPEEMLGAMGGLMKGMGGVMSMKFSDPKVEKLAEDDGGTILGLPTRHYRYRTSYTMEMKIFGMKKTTAIVKEEDVWASSKLVELALGVWLRKEPPKTGYEELDKLIAAEQTKIDGFPLRRVIVQKTTDGKGKITTTKTTTELTSLQLQPIPDSTFVMGPGYTKVEGVMPGMGKPPKGGGDEPTDDDPYPFDLMWKSLRQPQR